MGKIISLMATVVFLFTASFSVQAVSLTMEETGAQFNKGIELINRADYDAAFPIFSRLASQGFVPAVHYAGLFHQAGAGTPKNLKKAQEFFEKAGSEGYPESTFELAMMYFAGDISATEKETQEIGAANRICRRVFSRFEMCIRLLMLQRYIAAGVISQLGKNDHFCDFRFNF